MELFLAVISTAGLVGTILFIGVYHRTAIWWKNPYGRALFAVSISTFLFFTSAMLFNVFGADYPWRVSFRVVTLSFNTLMIWYLLVAIIRGGAKARADRRRERGLVRHEP